MSRFVTIVVPKVISGQTVFSNTSRSEVHWCAGAHEVVPIVLAVEGQGDFLPTFKAFYEYSVILVHSKEHTVISTDSFPSDPFAFEALPILYFRIRKDGPTLAC